jgi:carboxyl-terminal processing protease
LSLLNDPTTRFLTPSQVDALLADLGSEGTSTLGLTEVLRLDVDLRSHAITVISAVPGSPAAAAGLRPGDVVVSVDGKPIDGLEIHEVTSRLRRAAGETVTIQFRRGNNARQVQLDRKMKWSPPDGARFRRIDSKDKPAGLLTITSFTGDAGEKSPVAAAKFNEWGVGAIVVDLRGNPGGRIDVFTRITGQFLGEIDAAKIVDKQEQDRNAFKSNGTRVFPRVPVAVLVDHGTASAAEVFAAILKERAGAMILGSQTLGKTLAHNLFLLPDRSGIFLTLGELRTNQGTSLLYRGLKPDLQLDETDDPDVLVRRALELLGRKV